LRRAAARLFRKRGPVRIFRMTVSSYHYDEEKKELAEHEAYFTISRRARTVADIKRIRAILTEKGRQHYRAWLLKHLNAHVRRIHINFEPEYRASKQVE